ncbi:MAG: DUF885 family protein [Candidatus Eisenbacteria bacterium]
MTPAPSPHPPPDRLATPHARRMVAVAMVGALALTAPPAWAGRRDTALARLSDVYLQHWLPRHPAAATRLGARRYDNVLPAVSETSLAEDLAWTRALRTQVDSIPDSALDVTRRVDRAVLVTALERDRVALEVTRPWRSDPACVLPLARDAILVLTDPMAGPACRRIQPLAARLDQIPETMRAARVLLTEPDSAAVAAAIPRFDELIRVYRTVVGASVAECNEAARQARLAEADSAAVRAVADFTRALREELLPIAGHAPPMGGDAVTRWLKSEGIEGATPESLLAWAEAETLAAAGHDPVTMMSLADSAAALEWLRNAIDVASAGFSARERALTIPIERVRPRVRVLRRGGVRPPELALHGPGTWEPVGRGWMVEATLALPAQLPERETRDAVDRCLVDLTRANAARALPSALRQALAWDATIDGVRGDLGSAGGRAGGAAATAAWLRRALQGAAPGTPFVTPAEALAARGRWRHEALRAETRHSLGARWDARTCDDAVIAAGGAPWPVVRVVVLASLAGETRR